MLENCLEGLGSCYYMQLNPQEKKDVTRATQDRNLEECADDSDVCDRSGLTAEGKRALSGTGDRQTVQN